MKRLRRVGLSLALVSAALLQARLADAQSTAVEGDQRTLAAEAGIWPDTVTVGDRFLVRIRVTSPSGSRVEFPQFTLVEPVEAADSLRVTRDGSGAWTATYRLVAWAPGETYTARLPFRVVESNGQWSDRVVRVRLPVVSSVLPLDSALHIPRPAKAVLPIATPATVRTNWWLPVFLLAALGLVVAILASRGRRVGSPAVMHPREVALAELAAIEADRLTERGELDSYYVRTSRVLRHYLAGSAALGEDLTSAELLGLAESARLPEEARTALRRLLCVADRVKFAGGSGEVDAEGARVYGEALGEWIRRWPGAAHAGTGGVAS